MIIMFTVLFDIDLPTASSFTSNFQANNPNPSGVIGAWFSADAIQEILSQDGCQGIRYYFGIDPNGAGDICIILTGTDSSGNDMVNGALKEMAIPCPTECSSANALNNL